MSIQKIKDICISKLSGKRKLVIQFALDFPDKVVLMRMKEFADHLGVNPATVVKACKAVGLNGFFELRELLKQEVQLTRVDSVFTGMIQEVKSQGNPQKVAQDAILGDIMMLQKTYESMEFDVMEKIARAIIGSNHTYIVGLAHIGLVARYMERICRSAVPQIHASTEYHGELFLNMDHFSEKDVVVGICLDKCQNQTIDALKFAKERNATTVAIVDSNLSPLLEHSDLSILINSSHSFYFGGMVGAYSVVNAIFYSMANILKEETVARFKFFRDMSEKQNIYKT
ncbi:transcriptional regulator, RpiR family [Flagellimonas taeanensis]|jgi:DNA-binding MurR/RpiR family transcriptional regulator|uniref:Transcriptional regulator, RpiR family n=1 Tax=Flagellimonas taeanensis TaxID=1005926 RepID=A0A1M6WWW6_9FLAO|nr:MurR/RpiR family transcriptional regulator [Allomuricauda taeanensis]MEE1964157.1 MurR/RpiR family transcriptional regulator [Allomuricauda taeanensis]SFB99797.1 transcriptional regulator, RpiR family [Allomuricauda taeanensis]SHK98059.1 transcriptional regulator, RpiR family [Allomuricauda taeanensis]